MSQQAPDPADAIAAALAQLRERRRQRPPWAGDPGQPGQRTGPIHPGRRGPHGFGRPDHDANHGHPFGAPPWAGAGRIAGPARMRLLEALAAASAPLSVGQIAEAIGVDQPRASRLVQQVVDAGLARREADPDDARRTRVALTDDGSKIVRGFRGERRDAIDTALESFTEAERVELARLLQKLADGWPRD
ncbi:MarR family winged helix-turn-helix transcriptional regulator [Microbacterium lacus]|uniref:MarR family winged helix-turn-helix transcriptional regulator n=1 Tax=Microbacterium lacus TaxID=415217 RepID=UPI00384B2201